VLGVGLGAVAGEGGGEKLSEAERAKNVEAFEVAWRTIREKHWDPELAGLDWQAVHDEVRPQVEKAASRDEYFKAMQGMIDRFDQSHFAVIPKRVYDQMQTPAGEGPRDGTTGIDVRVIDGRVLVTRVDEGTPAADLGVKPGWEILEIDGKPLAPVLEKTGKVFQGKTVFHLVQHQAIVNRLIGEIGTSKAIRFRNAADEEVVLEVGLVSQKGTKFRLGIFPRSYVWIRARRLEGDVGYIAFNAFMDPVRLMPAFEKAVRSFHDAKGLVIDIRGNGGGIGGMAMGMAGWLVDRPDQFLGTMRLRGAEIRFVVNPQIEPFDGPVAVLIDGSSASCGEIFPGGLRDIGRARLFGTRTAGAVLPASFEKLPNGDFFYYPIADYVSRGGGRLEGVGVEPDVWAEHDRAALLEGRDNALEKAIGWIQSRGSTSSRMTEEDTDEND
jgi:carboxyl-terminal processing protease